MFANSLSELAQAWSQWASGQEVSARLLWGMRILWWGRIAKIVGLVSALTVVVEIVGPTRLRAFGRSLHEGFRPSVAIGQIRQIARWWAEFAQWLFMRTGKTGKGTGELDRRGPTVVTVLAFPLILVFGFWYYVVPVWSLASWWVLLLRSLLVFFGTGFLCGAVLPLMMLGCVTLSMLAMMLLDVIVIERVARVLEHYRFEKLIKALALLLLIISFHFDLLAS